ncbi:MAG: sodium:proton antiporter [archaeon]|nr:sodium:proton antiporter [archaeon]
MVLIAPTYEVIIAGLLGLMMVASFVALKTKLPYTLILVFIGLAIAGSTVSRFIGASLITNLIQGGLFVSIIVPPLIFEAMIHIKSADLKAVIRPSSILATLGVVIATLVCGVALWKIAGLPFYVSFLFAALISPTDAATVLGIFRSAKVPAKLSALIETEAAFNDATAVVVFSVVLASIQVHSVSIIGELEHFALIVGGGLAIGFIVAFVAELSTSLVQDRASETVLTISAVYGSYAAASALGFSGLIAVAIVGLYFGNLTVRTAMGPSTREALSIFWEVAAFIATSVAFLGIGLSTEVTSFASVATLASIFIAFAAVTASRIASVYPILSFFNRFGEKIPWKWQNVTVLGGMRGALSVALVFSITTSAVISATDLTKMQAMVFGVAFISLSLQAALLFGYISRRFPEEQAAHAEELNVKLARAVSAIESLQKTREESKISEEDFATELEKDKDQLREVLGEVKSTIGTTEILKTRASNLYSSIITLPMSRAMRILHSRNMDSSIQTMIENTTSPKNKGSEKQEGKREENPSGPS